MYGMYYSHAVAKMDIRTSRATITTNTVLNVAKPIRGQYSVRT